MLIGSNIGSKNESNTIVKFLIKRIILICVVKDNIGWKILIVHNELRLSTSKYKNRCKKL